MFLRRRHIRQLQRGAFRGLALGLAIFYVVSACRGVLPEVCATQKLMEQALEQQADGAACTTIGAVTTCCHPAARETDGPGGSVPATPTCAFCMLAKAVLEPLDTLRLTLAAEPTPPAPLPAVLPVLSRELDTAVPGRAPPSHLA